MGYYRLLEVNMKQSYTKQILTSVAEIELE